MTISHIVLPAPHAEFCLTPWLTHDPPRLVELMNIPSIVAGLSGNKNERITVELAVRHIQAVLEEKERWGYPILRYTRDVEVSEEPKMLGAISFFPFNFRALGQRSLKLCEEEKALPPEGRHWQFSCYVDPVISSKGLVTAATRWIIDNWFVPNHKSYPGQLVSSWFEPNKASQRVHDKLGFVGVARSVDWYEREKRNVDEDVICAVWQGAGECAKEDSVFRDLPSWSREEA
ncbi:hypothetical protein BCR39DRAFT_535507 [Naematelia encephala]|uniref:N-acetyltransferase domain-containing protein n=1 Tax=Naematelia encephala TaxID=71784 RepID=A0A1Y2B0Q6_9TREE|nr:hypothetical protein BCR39DRAFT_535507 [Naematelia encephala]